MVRGYRIRQDIEVDLTAKCCGDVHLTWFVETYLPGVVYYLVLPAVAGIVVACYLQFACYRRQQRLLYAPLDTIPGEDEVPPSEPAETEPAAEPIQIDNHEVLPHSTPALDDATTNDNSAEQTQQEWLGNLMMGTSESSESPEQSPGHIRPTDSEATDDPMQFFETKVREQEVHDPLQEILEEYEPVTNTKVATLPQVIEPRDALGEDLVRLVLGSNFDFDKLETSGQTSGILPPPSLPVMDEAV